MDLIGQQHFKELLLQENFTFFNHHIMMLVDVCVTFISCLAETLKKHGTDDLQHNVVSF